MGTILGTAGNDTLTSNGGNTLKGLAGDDLYNIGAYTDIVSEAAYAGIDTIHFSSNFNIGKTKAYTLAANVENLDLSAWDLSTNTSFSSAYRFAINGNALANTITIGDGNSSKINVAALGGNDTVFGGDADNYIDGGTGSDLILGGAGADTLYGGADYEIDTLDGGDGYDTYIVRDNLDKILDDSATNKITLDRTFTATSIDLATYTQATITEIDASAVSKGLSIWGNASTSTTITTGAGNNTIYSGTAADTLIGGKGNDTYVISDFLDTFLEYAGGGIDTIKVIDPIDEVDISLAKFVTIENIDASSISVDATLSGNTGINTIYGGSHDDTIYGGDDLVKDVLIGGEGSDTYKIRNLKDLITETGTGVNDIDTIQLQSDYDNSLPSPTTALFDLKTFTNIEAIDGSLNARNLTLNGNAKTSTTIIGGIGNDTLNGGTAIDTLYGGAGNDTLYGGTDSVADDLQGEAGDDVYIVRDNMDTISDMLGINTIRFSKDYAASTYSLASGFAGAIISGIDASAFTKAVTLTGNASTATTITGGSGSDIITGGSDIDSLCGGAGNDTLAGKGGYDTLEGGAGNDTYIVDDLYTDAKLVELPNVGKTTYGNDTIKLTSAFAPNVASLSINNAGVLSDDPLFANIENIDASAVGHHVTMTGNSLNNTLIGTNSADVIYGGGGTEADTLIGGKGSDTYFVTNSKNDVKENANEGFDVVVLDKNFNSNTFALDSNVEFLDATTVKKGMTLTGSSGSGTTIYATSFNDKVTGGAGNDIINGFAGNDALYGGAGNDTIDGGDGIDYIEGGAGDDTLYGSGDTVTDTLVGGDGSDVYLLKDTKDVIKDTSNGNTIRLNELFAEDTLSMANNAPGYNYSGAKISMLDAHHVGHGMTLTGNNALTRVTTVTPATDSTPATTITTTVGTDILIYGTDYNDVITGFAGDDTLWGGYGDTTIFGLGDDTIYGGAGTNVLVGGMGNDTYLVDGTETANKITENADTDEYTYGTDTIKLITNNGAFSSSVDWTKVNTAGTLNGLASYTVSLKDAANVEIIDGSLITGDSTHLATNLTLIGNDLKGGNKITGGSGNDTITGGAEADLLYGGDGNDTITGGKSGSEGAVNTLNGGNGDDTYTIALDDEESIKDNAWKVEEKTNADGSKTIEASIPKLLTAFSDSDGIDTIVLTGKSSYDQKYQEMFDLTLPNEIDNLDASAIAKDLSLNITGNSLDNYIIGGTGYDYISTGDGDDTIEDYAYYIKDGVFYYCGNEIDAGEGNNKVKTGFWGDTITSGSGHDVIYDLGGDNIIDAGDGDNRVTTGEGHDTITTGTGDDYIISGSGNDIINCGTGTNTIIGGAGNDTYIINSTNDEVQEEANAGNDTLKLNSVSTMTSLDLANYENFENLDGSLSSLNLTLTGNSADNILTTGTGNNSLIGGAGNDTYMISGKETSVTITETSGTDTIGLTADKYGRFKNLDSFSLSLGGYASIENIDGSAINGVDTTDHSIPPKSPNPTKLTLTGNALDNKITGGAGNDTINGAAGLNTLIGGNGNDIYIINSASEKVTETSTGGNDTLQLNNASGITSISLVNYSNVENIDGSAMTSTLTLTGSALDNTLIGGSGSNTLVGGAGNDTYVIKTIGDKITENLNGGSDTIKLAIGSAITDIDLNLASFANVENIDGALSVLDLNLTGNASANTLTGGTGDNNLSGGAGNDTYCISGIESSTTITDTSGVDTIKLISDTNGQFNGLSTYTLSLAGYATVENIDGSSIIGANLGDPITEELPTDLTLIGNAANNVLTGGGGNDSLYGGAGSNALIGGDGDDTYALDGTASATIITENANTATHDYGTDTVALINDGSGKYNGKDSATVSLAGYTNVENLNASLITATDLTLNGNALDNTITTGLGVNNTLVGGDGNDTYVINTGTEVISEDTNGGTDVLKINSGSIITALNLTANTYKNVESIDGSMSSATLTLTGNDSDNTLTSGTSANTLIGGKGNDTYVVIDANDVITEAASEGSDTVKLADTSLLTTIDLSLGGYVNVENIDGSLLTSDLTLTGDLNDNTIIGGDGDDVIEGGVGKDTLTGGKGADTFEFAAGDAKDLITSTDATDIINIDTSTGMTTADMLFYTDSSNNFYIDYTEGGVGTDVAEIASGKYDDNTTIQVGSSTIHINTIIAQLTVATKGLDSTAISALDTTVEASQVALLTWTP